MRKTGFGFFLFLCVAVVALLWRQTGREEARARRDPVVATPPGTPDEPGPTAGGLVVRDGVARAPKEEAVPADASGPTRFWTGRAVSTSTREGVAGATVALESVDEQGGWAQPPTVEGGFFVLRAPPGAPGSLRVVIESAEEEVGIEALAASEETVADLGTVWLAGHGALEGRVVDEHGAPAPDVRLALRRFGELEARPGVVAGATSDELGAFRLKRLPRGSFVLAGIGPEGRRYVAAPVLVPPADPLLLAPLPAADLQIEVRNTLGEPVSGARLEAIPEGVDPVQEPLDPALFSEPFLATTEDVGVADFPFLPPRIYTLLLELPDGSLFEFAHPHAHAEKRRLVVPTDPRLRILLIEVPEKGPPPQPPVPLRETAVQLTVTGRTSMPDRTVRRSLSVKTDDEGIAVLPRLGTKSVRVEAYAPDVLRCGVTTPALASRLEGLVSGTVAMRPVPPPEAEPEVAETPRRARVTLPGGVPVAGAKVYVGAKVRTDETGEADLGPATDEAKARLFRPELASGDPDAGKFGRRTLVELTWNEGEVVTVRVSDAVDGFPLTNKVRIHPRPSAWRIVRPGLFRSRWDVAYADPDADIVVCAPGYGEWRAPGGPGEFDARLQRPVASTATLELEVRSGNAPLPGLRVSGRANADWAESGRRDFVALTGAQGCVGVAGLAEGPWIIRADATDGRSVRREFTLAPGRNPLQLQFGGRPLVSGTVVDDRRHPVADARIERVTEEKRSAANRDLPATVFQRYPRLPAVRTDGRGRFGLGLPRDRRLYLFEVEAPGHQTQRFAVAARRRKKPLVVTLPRLAAVALPLTWADGRREAIPDDLAVAAFRRDPNKRGRWLGTGITAHVVDGRLRASGLPPGRLRFAPVGGRAWVPAFAVQAKPGVLLEGPTVRLHSGGTIEGRVTDDERPAAGFLFYANSRPVRTDAQGRFRVTGLPPGRYAIHAEDQTEESRIKNRSIWATNGFVSKASVRISRGRGR